jgi:hypothetical protein
MTQSVMQDKQGPTWPLGAIAVATPGTPVGIMSLVDPSSYNAPETATVAGQSAEYGGALCQQIMFQGFKSNAGTGMVPNVGAVYIMRKGAGGGLGNRTDYGAMVAVINPGQTIFIASAPRNRDTFSPYQFFLDCDSAGDGALVTLFPQ